MNFPYQERFANYLRNVKYLKETTIHDTCHDVDQLFKYLRTFNPLYRQNPDLSELTSSDLQAYFNWLQVQHQIKNSTYNKLLTHLNTYFIFLFQNNLTTSLPTIGLKGLTKKPKLVSDTLNIGWTKNLQTYLTDSKLSYYTRLMLLALSHFYPIQEILAPNFYQVLKKEQLLSFEKAFLEEFLQHYQELQTKQQTKDLFLKQRLNLVNPRLSLPGLHKYLRQDQSYCTLKLSPRQLYQAAILTYLKDHPTSSNEQLAKSLRLTPASLLYYRQQSSLI